MDKYIEIIAGSFTGYWNYLVQEISNPSLNNYFYYLLLASIIVYLLEIIFPWRKEQKLLRTDFWLDGFYMFFNFFIFSLIGFNAISNVGVALFNDFLGTIGWDNIIAIRINAWPVWAQFLLLFIVADFIQWSVHVALHRFKALWRFHKVHHSVIEMGFSAHLRFHFMETILYKTALFVPLSMIGYGIDDLFIWHAFTILIGHLNHANINWNYGPFKYLFNNPAMHIWHHAKTMPPEHWHGMNFGISLSVWDYLFGTAYLPKSGKDIELGFPDIEQYPIHSFWKQLWHPFKKNV